MDTAKSIVQPGSGEGQSESVDLHPLCCVATTPAPASWDIEHRLPQFLHVKRHLTKKSSYIVTAYTMTAVATGLNLLTPLYGLYRQEFEFSALTLTLIFAVYVVTIIPAILIFGPLADAIGRRRVLLISILAAALGPFLLLAASNTSWLFAARIMQGIAQGAVSGAASAALIELGSDLKKTALVVGTSVTGGIAIGPILSSILAQYTSAPLILPFLVYLVLLIPALLGTFWMSEPLQAADRRAFHPHRPSLPAEGKRAFLISTAVAIFGFAASALFLSVIPGFLVLLLHTTNIVLLTAPVGLFLAASPLVQLLLHNLPARRAAVLGLVLEVIGLLGTLVTAAMGSLPLLLVAAVIGGGGSGVAYLGSLSLVNQLIPKKQRGDVFGTYYALNYLSLGLTAVAVGLLTAPLGLTIAVRWVSAVVMVLCILTAIAVMRLLPSKF